MALSDIEINTLARIYEAMSLVDRARVDASKPARVRSALGRIYRELDAARGLLIDKHVEAYLADLESHSKAIEKVMTAVKADIARIRKLAAAMNTAADAIKFVVNTGKGAVSAGLL